MRSGNLPPPSGPRSLLRSFWQSSARARPLPLQPRTFSPRLRYPMYARPDSTYEGSILMLRIIHRICGFLAPLCIALFWASTVFVEFFESRATVAQLKSLIVTPGLWILIPAIAMAGISGMSLSRSRRGRLAGIKKKAHAFHCSQWPARPGALRDLLELVGGGRRF